MAAQQLRTLMDLYGQELTNTNKPLKLHSYPEWEKYRGTDESFESIFDPSQLSEEARSPVQAIIARMDKIVNLVFNHEIVLPITDSTASGRANNYSTKLKNSVSKWTKEISDFLEKIPADEKSLFDKRVADDLQVLEGFKSENTGIIIAEIAQYSAKVKNRRGTTQGFEPIPLMNENASQPAATGGAAGERNKPQRPRVSEIRIEEIPLDDLEDDVFDVYGGHADVHCSIGHYLKMEMLEDLNADDRDSLSTEELLEMIICKYFIPYHKVLSQDELNLLNQNARNTAKFRRIIDQRRAEVEREETLEIPCQVLDWIKDNIAPYNDGQPLPEREEDLLHLIKLQCGMGTGVELTQDILNSMVNDGALGVLTRSIENRRGTAARAPVVPQQPRQQFLPEQENRRSHVSPVRDNHRELLPLRMRSSTPASHPARPLEELQRNPASQEIENLADHVDRMNVSLSNSFNHLRNSGRQGRGPAEKMFTMLNLAFERAADSKQALELNIRELRSYGNEPVQVKQDKIKRRSEFLKVIENAQTANSNFTDIYYNAMEQRDYYNLPGNLRERYSTISMELSELTGECRDALTSCLDHANKHQITTSVASKTEEENTTYKKFGGGYGVEDYSFFEFFEDQENIHKDYNHSERYKYTSVKNNLTGWAKNDVETSHNATYQDVMNTLRQKYGRVGKNMSKYKALHEGIGQIPSYSNIPLDERAAVWKQVARTAGDHRTVLSKAKHMFEYSPSDIYMLYDHGYLSILGSILPSTMQLDIATMIDEDPAGTFTWISKQLDKLHTAGLANQENAPKVSSSDSNSQPVKAKIYPQKPQLPLKPKGDFFHQKARVNVAIPQTTQEVAQVQPKVTQPQPTQPPQQPQQQNQQPDYQPQPQQGQAVQRYNNQFQPRGFQSQQQPQFNQNYSRQPQYNQSYQQQYQGQQQNYRQQRGQFGGGRQYQNDQPRYNNQPLFVLGNDPDCSFCKHLQMEGIGSNYFENHVYKTGNRSSIKHQCPNYVSIGIPARVKLIKDMKLCHKCLKPLANHTLCLNPGQEQQTLCQAMDCGERIENCSQHKDLKENIELIDRKKYGLSKSNLHLVLFASPFGASEVDNRFEELDGFTEKKSINFLDGTPSLGDSAMYESQALSHSSCLDQPTRPLELSIDQMLRIPSEVIRERESIFIFGKLQGKTRPILVLYDTGAATSVFDQGILGYELPAARNNADPTAKVVGVGGSLQAERWKVSLSLRDPTKKPVCVDVLAVDGLNIRTGAGGTKFQQIFDGCREQFEESANMDLSHIKVSDDIGDQLDGLIGLDLLPYFPQKIADIPCGLELYCNQFKTHNEEDEFLIGGTLDSIASATNSNTIDSTTVAMVCYFFDETKKANPKIFDHELDDNEEKETPPPLKPGEKPLEMEDATQKNLVTMQDCFNSGNDSTDTLGEGTSTTFIDRDAPIGSKVESAVMKALNDAKCSGCRQLLVDLNSLLGNTIIEARCPKCLGCPGCKAVDPFATFTMQQERENFILLKCMSVNNETGEYYHYLPFKLDPYKYLRNNEHMARSTLNRALIRLQKGPQTDRDLVKTSFEKLVKAGFVKKFSELDQKQQELMESKSLQIYISWNVVYKDSLSTPCRVVYNASQRNGKYSLNDMLIRGDLKNKLALDLTTCAFACDKFALSTDISKFYNCLKLQPEHYNFQNILWTESMRPEDPPERFVITTAIYGVNSSSCATEYMLNHIASTVSDDELLHWVLKSGRYVDDIMTSLPTLESALEIKQKLLDLFDKHNIKCKGWAITGLPPDESISENGKMHVGGYIYHTSSDTLSINVPKLNFSGEKHRGKLINTKYFEGESLEEVNQFTPDCLTIRMALSKIASIFDVRGLIQPYFLLTKLAFQDSIQALGGISNESTQTGKRKEVKAVLTDKMWDMPLPSKQRLEWVSLFHMAEQIRKIRFQRFAFPRDISTVEQYLFGFGDAAEPGCQECVYLGYTNDGNDYHLSLFMAKNQVNSRKKAITIPNLELDSLALTAALIQKCKLSLRNVKKVFLMGDSVIALSWIKDNSPSIAAYQRRRCAIVRKYVDIDDCYHLRTNFNPADKGTRPIVSIEEIGPESLYIKGPSCLHDMEKSIEEGIITPISKLTKIGVPSKLMDDARLDKTDKIEEYNVMTVLSEECQNRSEDNELENSHSGSGNKEYNEALEKASSADSSPRGVLKFLEATRDAAAYSKQRDFYYSGFASMDLIEQIGDRYRCWEKFVRVWARVLHAADKFRSKNPRSLGQLMPMSKMCLLQSAMYDTKMMLKHRPLKDFINFTSGEGIRRVKTRMAQQNFNPSSLIVLSHKNPIAKKILFSIHNKDHSGITAMVAKSRIFYWIPQASRLAKIVKKECFKCRLLDAQAVTQLMAPVPQHRLKSSPPWTHSMVDLFGPITVKGANDEDPERKTWGILITCLTSRAMWAYLSESYSTKDFLTVLRKHESRNGSPQTYYADLGSQIVGADKLIQKAIKDLDQKGIEDFSAGRKVEFKFGSPLFKFGSPFHSQGQGAVERLVKVVKRHLKVITKARLTFGELDMLLSEASYLVNSRPLQYYPQAGSDGYICPNDILFGRSDIEPPIMTFEDTDVFKRLGEKQAIIHEFWEKWSNSYLQSLHRYSQWEKGNRNLREGDIVLVLDQTIRKGKFLLGEIETVTEADDGLVRRVNVKYKLYDKATSRAVLLTYKKGRRFKSFERNARGVALLVPAEERDQRSNKPEDDHWESEPVELQNEELISVPDDQSSEPQHDEELISADPQETQSPARKSPRLRLLPDARGIIQRKLRVDVAKLKLSADQLAAARRQIRQSETWKPPQFVDGFRIKNPQVKLNKLKGAFHLR